MTLLYPGSFDPVTYGHIDIALRGAKLASRLIVSVVANPNKSSLFSVEERMRFLREAFQNHAHIEMDSFSGLLAEYAAIKGATAILRGLRTAADFETESRYAAYNRMLSAKEDSEKIDTVFIAASPKLSHVSSSIVREAAAHIYVGHAFEPGDIALAAMVMPSVRMALRNKYVKGKG